MMCARSCALLNTTQFRMAATAVNPVQVQKFLSGIDYPADKQTLINTAREQGADDNVMNTLRNLPDREYDAPTAVTREIGKLG